MADLWHEVAGTLFFLRKGREIAAYAPAKQSSLFLARLADHYADILVYLQGFGGDLDRFLASLAHGWKLTYAEADELVQRYSVGDLLLRAYLVFEFAEVRKAQTDVNAARVLANPESSGALVSRLETVASAKFTSIPLRAEDWLTLRTNVVKRDFSDFHRNLYHDFIATPPRVASVDIRPFLRGEVTALDDSDDLNDLFGELALVLTTKKAGAFRAMAALGKSAAVEYHRRQVLRREVSWPPPRQAKPEVDPDATPVFDTSRTRKQPLMQPYPPRHRLGGCKIERHIGSGKMGHVYAAVSGRAQEKVALKVAVSAAVSERMIEEARLGRKISHRNVCRIFNQNYTRDGLAYIEMELIEGGDDIERAIIKAAPFSENRLGEIAAELFDGLAEIHKKKVLHRDLKPTNVMLDAEGSVRIMDLGLAIAADAAQNDFAGTMHYMAPEVRAKYSSPETSVQRSRSSRKRILGLGNDLCE